MKGKKRLSAFLLLLSIFPIMDLHAGVNEWADDIFNARRAGRLIPVFAERLPEIDVEKAYSVQKAYVEDALLMTGFVVLKQD